MSACSAHVHRTYQETTTNVTPRQSLVLLPLCSVRCAECHHEGASRQPGHALLVGYGRMRASAFDVSAFHISGLP